MLSKVDIITCHASGNKEILGKQQFKKIKKGHMLRKHPTETMHADGWTGADPAWVAIHFFLLGDISKNHILYAYPPNDFHENFKNYCLF